MSANRFNQIMKMCLGILDTNLNIFGYNIRLVSFIAFDLLLGMLLWAVLDLFNRE